MKKISPGIAKWHSTFLSYRNADYSTLIFMFIMIGVCICSKSFFLKKKRLRHVIYFDVSLVYLYSGSSWYSAATVLLCKRHTKVTYIT